MPCNFSPSYRRISRALPCWELRFLVSFGHQAGVRLRPPVPEKDKALHIYFVDVEGGQATLFVTPAGQSLLIDTGWPGNEGRDADRIVAAREEGGNRAKSTTF